MNETNDRRAAQDQIIQSALAQGASYAQAGEAAGVSARTVRRRMTEEWFSKEVAILRAERVGQVASELVELSVASLAAVRECLESGPLSIRLRAADLALTHMSRLRREHDIDVRLATIEEMLKSAAAASGAGGQP